MDIKSILNLHPATHFVKITEILRRNRSFLLCTPRSKQMVAGSPLSVSDESSLWIFRKLWYVCFRSNYPRLQERSNPSPFYSTGIKLNIPTTVLFDEDGSPRYWLFTSAEGRLWGLEIGSAVPNHKANYSCGRYTTSEDVRHVVIVMQEFWEHVNGGSSLTVDRGPMMMCRVSTRNLCSLRLLLRYRQ